MISSISPFLKPITEHRSIQLPQLSLNNTTENHLLWKVRHAVETLPLALNPKNTITQESSGTSHGIVLRTASEFFPNALKKLTTLVSFDNNNQADGFLNILKMGHASNGYPLQPIKQGGLGTCWLLGDYLSFTRTPQVFKNFCSKFAVLLDSYQLTTEQIEQTIQRHRTDFSSRLNGVTSGLFIIFEQLRANNSQNALSTNSARILVAGYEGELNHLLAGFTSQHYGSVHLQSAVWREYNLQTDSFTEAVPRPHKLDSIPNTFKSIQQKLHQNKQISMTFAKFKDETELEGVKKEVSQHNNKEDLIFRTTGTILHSRHTFALPRLILDKENLPIYMELINPHDSSQPFALVDKEVLDKLPHLKQGNKKIQPCSKELLALIAQKCNFYVGEAKAE
jgi:hypothetical protein